MALFRHFLIIGKRKGRKMGKEGKGREREGKKRVRKVRSGGWVLSLLSPVHVPQSHFIFFIFYH